MTACLSLNHETFAPSSSLYQRFQEVRRFTAELCAALVPEDYVLQSMPDASPTRWHLAHTTWFFETFVLPKARPGYRAFHPAHRELFNSLRAGKTIFNGDYMATSTMLAILGRMATYTGQKITWEQAVNSKEDLTPEKYEWGPVSVPSLVARPGQTKFA